MNPDPKLIILVAIFLLLIGVEILFKARPWSGPRRMALNLGLGLLNMGLGRLLAATITLGAAAYAASQGWGLFNLFELPLWLVFTLGLLAMEMTIYWQHRLFHTVPFLWRWHSLHHRDEAIDLTTGVRFHPVEAVLSGLIKAAAAIALGLPPIVVLTFETWLTAASLWEHSNLKLPLRFDRALRLVFVTPAMHLVHHHDNRADHDTNYGFFLSIWDRLFGTYKLVATHSRKIGL
ncbi:MAG: hypothetical protein Hens3KO_17660 [Henriciella sp.]